MYTKDQYNENLMFQGTPAELLSRIVKKNVNVIRLAKLELANRGLDSNGKWIGFKAAEKHFKLK